MIIFPFELDVVSVLLLKSTSVAIVSLIFCAFFLNISLVTEILKNYEATIQNVVDKITCSLKPTNTNHIDIKVQYS